MRLAVTLLVLLLAVTVQAADWRDNTYPDTTVITSLPYTIPSNNRVYVLNGNLNSNDGGIVVNGRNNIKIDGRGNTITFDRDGSGGVIGMRIDGNSHHVVVANMTITQAINTGSYGSPGGDNCTGIQLGASSYLYIRNVNAHVSGHSSMCLDGGQGYKQAVEIHGGNYTSYTRSFDSRHQSDAAAFKLASPDPSPDTTFHFYVHEVRIDSACHAGVLVGGIAWVDSNYVNIDTYNQKPGTSWANAHAIADAGHAWAGSHFRYNTIRTGNRHYGGRGLYFNFSAGTPQNPVDVAYNDIRVNQGYTTEADAARGIRIRWGCFGLHVHHNYIEVVCDNNSSTQHIGTTAHGIWFSATDEEGAQRGANNWFYNNTIKTNFLGPGSTGPSQCAAFIADVIRDPNQPFGNNNRSFNNRFISNVRCLQFADEGAPGNEWTSINDTIEWVEPRYVDSWGFRGAVAAGAGGVLALNNWLVDPVFINCSQADIVNRSGGGSKSVYCGRGVQVQVVSSQNGLPVPNATVRIFTRYNNPSNLSTAMTTRTTNSNGLMYDTLAHHFRRWEGSSLAYDSTFNDYTIRVDANGATAQQTITVSDIAAGQPSGHMIVPIQINTSGTGGNTAPTAPVVNSPANGATVASLTPSLRVTNGTDADGDQLTYEFQLYDASGSTVLFSQAGIAQTPTTTSWTVPSALVNGTSYRWRARCSDGTATSSWTSMVSFTVNTGQDNIAPAAPVMHAPQIGATVNQVTPTLSVINATDADNDELTYTFELYDETGATLVASVSDLDEGSTYTTWTVPNPLSDLTTYSWRVRAFDGEDYSEWTELWDFQVNLSVALGLPVHSSPIDSAEVVGGPVVLIVNNATHGGADDVTYDFVVYSNAGLTNIVEEINGVEETAAKTSATLTSTLQHNQRYWWRVRASNGTETTEFTEPSTFLYLSFGSDDQTVALAAFPPDGGVSELSHPVLGTTNIGAPGDHEYTFVVATDPAFSNVVDQSEPVPQDESGQTSWQTSVELEEEITYYWHVRADNYSFSPTSTFQVVEKVFAYPNPVKFSDDGLVTFQLPDDEAVDLLIQTVSGETVILQKGITGDWQWDLRNGSGTEIAVGTYLWYVSGSKQSGKIVVLP